MSEIKDDETISPSKKKECFTKEMAKKVHKSQRWVQLQIQMGNGLSEESKKQIIENPKLIQLAKHFTGLLQLSRFNEEDQKLILN